MAQYIDKDALVAEIEKLDALYHTSKDLSGDLFIQGLFCFLDTLEVKEVDLEKKLYDIKRACGIFKENDIGEISGNCLSWVAQHYFELGMAAVSNKAQKGEEV